MYWPFGHKQVRCNRDVSEWYLHNLQNVQLNCRLSIYKLYKVLTGHLGHFSQATIVPSRNDKQKYISPGVGGFYGIQSPTGKLHFGRQLTPYTTVAKKQWLFSDKSKNIFSYFRVFITAAYKKLIVSSQSTQFKHNITTT